MTSINPRTGEGWTAEEEATFAEIMRIGRMERMAAIRLFRRCRSNAAKALALAVECGKAAETSAARAASLRRLKEGPSTWRRDAA